jgi:hypothetical protein
MDKKAEHATEVALTALDKLASLVEAKAGTGGMSPKLAKAIVRELDKVADQLELTMFGEDSLLYRQASILSKTANSSILQELERVKSLRGKFQLEDLKRLSLILDSVDDTLADILGAVGSEDDAEYLLDSKQALSEIGKGLLQVESVLPVSGEGFSEDTVRKVKQRLISLQKANKSLNVELGSMLSKTATVFPSQEAMDAYLKAHPNADKSKHSVDKDDEDTKKLKKDLGAFKDMQKGKEKSDKGKEKRKQDKGQKEDKAQFDKLKNDLESWRDAK